MARDYKASGPMLDSRRYCRYHRGAHRSIRVGLGKVAFHDMSGTSSGVPGFPLTHIHPSAREADQQKYSPSFLSLGPSRAAAMRTHCRSGSLERDTEVDFEHSLEHGPCYPLSVKVDATRNARAHRLEGSSWLLRTMRTCSSCRCLRCRSPSGEVYREIPSAPGRASLESSKKAISGSPCSSSTHSA